MKKIILPLLGTIIMFNCKNSEPKKTLDYTEVKNELHLDASKAKKFDAITAKYQKIRDESHAAAEAAKTDRVAMGIKNEEILNSQKQEMSTVLSPEQMTVFNKFVEEHTRHRPRYTDEKLAQIKSDAGLSEQQFAVVNAANNAFEKSFVDAHEIYHGNEQLAQEYWQKFDAQRKEAIKKVLTLEQYARFLSATADVKLPVMKK